MFYGPIIRPVLQQSLGEIVSRLTFLFQWIRVRLILRHVDYTMNVEANLFRVGGPVLVAEAVHISAVMLGFEGVVS